MKRLKEDDVRLLLPVVQEVVPFVLLEMQRRGFDPLVRDTLRTQEEADRNAALGVGISRSIHMYGAALDVICGKHSWSCSAHGCEFYSHLQIVGEAAGLVSGARFRKVDRPHLQAVKVIDQWRLYAIGKPTSQLKVDRLDALVRKLIGRNTLKF